jgi:hypothetical protein
LGALVRTHRVDTARRGRIALVTLIIGVVVTPLGVLFAVITDRTSDLGDDVVPWVVLGAALAVTVRQAVEDGVRPG